MAPVPTQHTPFLSLADGAVEELWQRLTGEIAASIVDPNHPAEATRKLSFEVSFKPTPDRRQVRVTLTNKLRIPSVAPVETFLLVQQAVGGPAILVEPQQGKLPFQATLVQ